MGTFKKIYIFFFLQMPLCLCIWLTGLSCPDFQGGGRPRSVGWSKLPLPARVGCGGRGGRAPHSAEEVCQLLTTQSTESRALSSLQYFCCCAASKNHLNVSFCRRVPITQDQNLLFPLSNLASESVVFKEAFKDPACKI